MRGIDDDHIHTGFDQRTHAVFRAVTDTNRCTDQQLTLVIFTRIREIGGFLDVFYGNQTAQLEFIVDDQHFFDTVRVQQGTDLFLACALFHRHQTLFRGHDGADWLNPCGFQNAGHAR